MKRITGALLVLAAIWYGRGYLERSAPKLEVSDLKCVQTSTEVLVSGTVKNISDKPLSLTANAVLTGNPDAPLHLKDQAIKGSVTPGPLPPGESGRFEIHARVPANWPPAFARVERSLPVGYCKLMAFTDDGTGRGVNYRER